jgi:ribosomal protein S18 acetylase RimI-like enzyme
LGAITVSFMQIRQLREADARAYQSLRLLALKENPTAFSSSFEDEAGRSIDDVAGRIGPAKDGSICMLGIFVQDELAGFLAVVHPQREKLRHCVELAGMYIASNSRRHGLGLALMQAAIAHARSIPGVRQIKLGVNAENIPANELYRSVGFKSYGTEPGALKIDGKLYDQTLYVLRLDPV